MNNLPYFTVRGWLAIAILFAVAVLAGAELHKVVTNVATLITIGI